MAQLQSLSINGNPVVDYITEAGSWTDSSTYGGVTWIYRKYASGRVEMSTSGTANNVNVASGRDFHWKFELPFEVTYDYRSTLFVNMSSKTTALWCGHIYLCKADNSGGVVSQNNKVKYISWSTWNNNAGSVTEEYVNWNMSVSAYLAS